MGFVIINIGGLDPVLTIRCFYKLLLDKRNNLFVNAIYTKSGLAFMEVHLELGKDTFLSDADFKLNLGTAAGM